MIQMRISVIGCGYLGAVHAAAMAELGHQVVGVESDPQRVASLNRGESFFFEPGFERILHSGMARGDLRFTDDIRQVASADVHFIAVGTPQSPHSCQADLSFLEQAVDSLEQVIPASSRSIIVGKSTVPVGTAAKLASRLAGRGTVVVWNPEFLRESHAVADTLHPDRIVYGLPDDPELAEFARQRLDEVYRQLLDEGIPRLVTNYATAELVKMACNAFLATKISFINGMAELCEVTGGDVTVLADAMGRDARIGRAFLGAGLGFGGGCLPKDIRALMARAEALNVYQAVSFLDDVDAINQRRRKRLVTLVEQNLDRSLSGARIAMLGASFKPNSDDVRDSPALDVARRLHRAGAQVRLFDPKGMANAARVCPELRYCADLTGAVHRADLVVVGTEWPEFVLMDPDVLTRLVARKVIIDGRNALDPNRWQQAGWVYRGLGR